MFVWCQVKSHWRKFKCITRFLKVPEGSWRSKVIYILVWAAHKNFAVLVNYNSGYLSGQNPGRSGLVCLTAAECRIQPEIIEKEQYTIINTYFTILQVFRRYWYAFFLQHLYGCRKQNKRHIYHLFLKHQNFTPTFITALSCRRNPLLEYLRPLVHHLRPPVLGNQLALSSDHHQGRDPSHLVLLITRKA